MDHGAEPMLPSRNQIEHEAYNRWIRRDRAHGHDRHDWLAAENELTFLLNYRTVVEFPLHPAPPVILGADKPRRCRFCERAARQIPFSEPRSLMQVVGETSLFSAEICDECQADCRDPLACHSHQMWDALSAEADSLPHFPRSLHLIAAFKSLITSALLVMPLGELEYFSDTLEWVNNPDFEYDGSLLTGSFCRVYVVPFAPKAGWINLSRRIHDEAAMPYMLFFAGWRGFVLQLPLPLCIRDQDLDGKDVQFPVRSPMSGRDPHFQQAGLLVLRSGVR
jgi:Protein of unknown function (DUF2934)